MKTVLIVEDEKMIRQGIRTMIQRSGVPVEVILECSNGQMALEVVKEQKIDVMFTDIRMPKMDGIQLVREIQKLDEKPEIVAISGYDDFSYAVEMLRNGVREYILKPIERQKITEILQKLEREKNSREAQNRADIKISQNQIKHLLVSDAPSEEEFALLEKKYEERFFPKGYRVCVAGKGFVVDSRDGILFMDQMKECNLCILEPQLLPILQKNELWQEYAGVSREHYGLRELKDAFREAFAARRRAFYRIKNLVEADEPLPRIPDGLRKEAQKQIEPSAWTQRVHLIGTEKTEEIERQWEILFAELRKERIAPEEFECGIRAFFDELTKIYRSIIGEQMQKQMEECRIIYQYANMEEYEDDLMALVMELHNRSNDAQDGNRNQQKMKQAVDYITKNYHKDLNMAVVSNYVSMNYSLFSYAFKQYTGSNFVSFLKELRMEEAKKLLAETDMKVIEISQQVGYENEKHFMKTFKAACGVSPSEYRRNMQHK